MIYFAIAFSSVNPNLDDGDIKKLKKTLQNIFMVAKNIQEHKT